MSIELSVKLQELMSVIELQSCGDECNIEHIQFFLDRARIAIKDKYALIQSYEQSMQEAWISPIQRLVNLLNQEIALIFNAQFTRRSSVRRGGKVPIDYKFTHNDLDTIYIETPPMKGMRFYVVDAPGRSSLTGDHVKNILITRTNNGLAPEDISRVSNEKTHAVFAISPDGVQRLLSVLSRGDG
jgi:hypothetical protein